MLANLKNVFKIPDLRNKILFTGFIVALFRLGCHIPLPFVDFSAIQQLKDQAQLDGWLRDGSKEYVESLCDFA